MGTEELRIKENEKMLLIDTFMDIVNENNKYLKELGEIVVGKDNDTTRKIASEMIERSMIGVALYDAFQRWLNDIDSEDCGSVLIKCVEEEIAYIKKESKGCINENSVVVKHLERLIELLNICIE